MTKKIGFAAVLLGAASLLSSFTLIGTQQGTDSQEYLDEARNGIYDSTVSLAVWNNDLGIYGSGSGVLIGPCTIAANPLCTPDNGDEIWGVLVTRHQLDGVADSNGQIIDGWRLRVRAGYDAVTEGSYITLPDVKDPVFHHESLEGAEPNGMDYYDLAYLPFKTRFKTSQIDSYSNGFQVRPAVLAQFPASAGDIVSHVGYGLSAVARIGGYDPSLLSPDYRKRAGFQEVYAEGAAGETIFSLERDAHFAYSKNEFPESQHGDGLYLEAFLMSGDSGGGVYLNGELIGINSHVLGVMGGYDAYNGFEKIHDSQTWLRNTLVATDYVHCRSEGDFSCNGVLDAADIDALAKQIRLGGNNLAFDLNQDSVVNMDDHQYMVEELLETNYGDANLDGKFNSGDLVQVFTFGEYNDDISKNSTWEEGDFDGDGDFTSADFVIAFQAGAYE